MTRAAVRLLAFKASDASGWPLCWQRTGMETTHAPFEHRPGTTLVLMLLGAMPAMVMAADLQVSTEVFVEAGDNPSFKLQQAPALLYSTALATPPDTFLQTPMAVLLVAQLDELGHVSNVMVARSSRLREMDRAALTAVDQWRFDPVVVEGVALHARVRVRLTLAPTADAPPG